jgi:hypothetical protein
LDGGDRHDLTGALDLLDSDVGDADMPDLPTVPVLLDRAEALLERRLGVGPVQVVEPEAVRPQPAEAFLDLGAERIRASAVPAAFRRDDAIVGDRRERSADRLFALSSGVGVGVSMTFTPAATASLMKATCSAVRVSRFVPSPIRATSVSPSLRCRSSTIGY